MTGFADDWLALREPADHRARNRRLVARLCAHFGGAAGLTVLDLGAGTGSTVRALAGLLPGPQRWRLVDDDRAHLDRAGRLLADRRDRAGRPLALEPVAADLAADFPAPLLDGVDLVATSAFLDLVSRPFLERLAAAARGHPIYAALSVDGRIACTPEDPLDRAVFAAFAAHMGRDKGFGPALGPRAAAVAAAILRERGWRVATGRSDWRIAPDEAPLARRLLDGWATAAAETGRLDPTDLARWHDRRRAEITAGTFLYAVGHRDLLALPA